MSQFSSFQFKMVSMCLEKPICTSPRKCCYDDGDSRPDGEGVQEITGAVPGREPTPLCLLQVRCPGAHQVEGSVTFCVWGVCRVRRGGVGREGGGNIKLGQQGLEGFQGCSRYVTSPGRLFQSTAVFWKKDRFLYSVLELGAEYANWRFDRNF